MDASFMIKRRSKGRKYTLPRETRICTVIKSKYPPVRLALPLRYEPPPDAENPTAFAWEIDGKKIDKSDLTVKNIHKRLGTKDPYEPSKSNMKFANECNITPDPATWSKTIKRHTNVPRIRSFFTRLTNAIACSNKQYHRYKRIVSPRSLFFILAQKRENFLRA